MFNLKQGYGEFTASQPWELIVTTLILLMASLVWVGDLGNHVMNKANSESPGSESGYINNGCTSESKEAISPIWNSDEYQSDGTQMEKVIRHQIEKYKRAE